MTLFHQNVTAYHTPEQLIHGNQFVLIFVTNHQCACQAFQIHTLMLGYHYHTICFKIQSDLYYPWYLGGVDFRAKIHG